MRLRVFSKDSHLETKIVSISTMSNLLLFLFHFLQLQPPAVSSGGGHWSGDLSLTQLTLALGIVVLVQEALATLTRCDSRLLPCTHTLHYPYTTHSNLLVYFWVTSEDALCRGDTRPARGSKLIGYQPTSYWL